MDDMIFNAQRLKLKGTFKSLKRWVLWGAAVLVVLVLVFNSFYIVYEAEQAVVSNFGIIKQVILAPDNDFLERNPGLVNAASSKLQNVDIVNRRGLHFKIPFITDVNVYNARLFTYVSDTEIVNTADKKQYYLTIFAQWSIANPGLFEISLKSMSRAEPYLDNIIFPAVVQNVNRLNAEDFIGNKDKLNEVLAHALNVINEDVRDSGIELADIQVYRTALPQANLETTYQKMIADRAKVAQQLRSEGEETYEKAVAAADLEAKVIESSAISESERIKGEADAEALRIYAEAYSADPEFYTYWRSLKALESALTENTTIVLDEQHPLWNSLLEWAGIEDAPSPTPEP